MPSSATALGIVIVRCPDDLHGMQANLGEEAMLVAGLTELSHRQRPIGLQRQVGEQVAEQLRG